MPHVTPPMGSDRCFHRYGAEMSESSSPAPEVLATRLRTARYLNVALGAAVVFLLIVVFAMRGSDDPSDRLAAGSRSDDSVAVDDGAGSTTAVDRSFADADHPFVIGDPDAPVVLNEWIDMRCPFCALFNNETLPILMDEYVEAGLVRIEVHAVSFFGEQSTAGAVALRAAADQGRFEEYMNVLYAAAPDKGHPDHGRDVLLGFARDAGVPDLDAFEARLDDDELSTAVHTATSEAQRLGVQAVPFFVVGDQAVSGAQPVDTFRALLDQALTQAEDRAEPADS